MFLLDSLRTSGTHFYTISAFWISAPCGLVPSDPMHGHAFQAGWLAYFLNSSVAVPGPGFSCGLCADIHAHSGFSCTEDLSPTPHPHGL